MQGTGVDAVSEDGTRRERAGRPGAAAAMLPLVASLPAHSQLVAFTANTALLLRCAYPGSASQQGAHAQSDLVDPRSVP